MGYYKIKIVEMRRWNYKGYEELIEKKIRYKYYIRYIYYYIDILLLLLYYIYILF